VIARKKFLVSEVRPTTQGETFNILTELGYPLVKFVYGKRQDAIDAREMIKAALLKVLDVDFGRR
jgi:hypothetical protein